MKYADLLKKYIRESRLTLDEISEILNKLNLTASKQYLSKLQNGRTPPASDELNRALAEITGGDPEPLIISSFTEKAPEEVKKIFTEATHINELTNSTIKCFFNLITDHNGNLLDNIRVELIEELKKNGVVINDESFIKNSDELYRLLEIAGVEEKIQILEVLQELALRNDSTLSDLIRPPATSESLKEDKLLKDISITPELSEFFNDLRDLPPHEQKDIIEQALTYLYGKKARNRLS
ncbi:hypothetical protein [Brevibacillus laterosporus]|uniref:hypothetical protein n=1 Tax=Brevibacillus laterosporus TaxID=1465 RepID=UPI003D1E96AD